MLGRTAEKTNGFRRYEDVYLLVIGADETRIDTIVKGLEKRGIHKAADRVIQTVSGKSSAQIARLWIADSNLDEETVKAFARQQRVGKFHQIVLDEDNMNALPATPGDLMHVRESFDEALDVCAMHMRNQVWVVS